MIKTKKGKTRIKGTRSELLSDLCIIVGHLYFYTFEDMEKEEVKARILDAVEMGFKTDEELNEHILEKMAKIISEFSGTVEKDGEEE